MRILHIDETFHPAFGYQCNPLAKFQSKQGNEVYIITVTSDSLYPVYQSFGETGENLVRQDEEYEKISGVKIIRVPTNGYVMNRVNFKPILFDEIEKIKPDVIMAHGVETLTSMRAIRKLKNKYPLVFDSHMLAMASKNKFAKIYEFVFRNTFTKTIKKKNYYIIKTQNDNYVTTHLGIPEVQAPFISFGTDTMHFKPSPSKKAEFRNQYGIAKDAFVVVYTGKLDESKGGMLFAETFLKKFNTPREVVCIVVANFPDDYSKKVEKLLKKSENKILFFPIQSYLDLPVFYQAADLSVFAKQCSMSFYDAQACGLPVVSEDNNINVDRCSHGNGLNFKEGSAKDFREKIETIAALGEEEYQKMSDKSVAFIKNSYDYEEIAKKYTEILEQEYARFHQN